MKIQDAKFDIRDNGTYLEILSHDLNGYTHLGDVCAAQFILGKAGARELARRIAASLNLTRGIPLEEIQQAAIVVKPKCPSARRAARLLTDEQVRWVRSCGLRNCEMMKALGVSKNVISKCLAFETYKEIR